jgi:restriction system protein
MYGRTRSLLTNKRLEAALLEATGLTLAQTYTTNAFPFIKPGGMSSNLRLRDLLRTVEEFTKPELNLAKPSTVVALGSLTQKALDRSGVEAIGLPHPAARGMSGSDYTEMWCAAFGDN